MISVRLKYNIQAHMKLIVILQNTKFHYKLDFNFDSTTDLIIQLSQLLNLKQSQIIISCKNSQKLRLRILKGWTLNTYGIVNGNQIYVRILSNAYNLKILSKSSLMNGIDNPPTYKVKAISEKNIQTQQQEPINNKISNKNHPIILRSSSEFQVGLQKYYNDVLLDLIKNKDLNTFKKALEYNKLVIISQVHQCERQYYQRKILQILKQPGQEGWCALHVAIYCNKLQTVSFLLSLNIIDINRQSLDGWTPLQLAIENYKKICKYETNQISKNLQHTNKKPNKKQTNQWKILQLILNCPKIDVNICTVRNIYPLQSALILGDINLLSILLQKNADPFQSTFSNRNKTIMDNCLQYERQNMFDSSNKCIFILKQLFLYSSKPSKLLNQTLTIYKGEVTQMRSFPQFCKKTYLQINIESNTITMYKCVEHYPKKPLQMFLLSNIEKVEKILSSRKNQTLSKILQKINQSPNKELLFQFHISLVGSKLYRFACISQSTVDLWINAIQQCRKITKQMEGIFEPYGINFIKMVEKDIVDECGDISKSEIVEKKPNFKAVKIKSQYDNLLQIFAKPIQIVSNDNTSSFHPLVNSLKQSSFKSQKNIQYLNLQNSKKILYTDFKFIAALGQGSFGKVFLAQYKQTGKKYALKAISKKQILTRKQLKFVASELNILKKLDFPFVIKMHFTFQTSNYVYLGLDFCEKKDLSHHILQQGHFSQDDTAFYAAQLLLALQYVHSKNILYRDLKPQNVLLSNDGHVKLTDFGLSKQLKPKDNASKRQSFCGSPAYLSPEMLDKLGARKQTDYYGLGTIIYQMLVGQPPFYDPDINIIYKNIKQAKLKFPKYISQRAKSLLNGLLEKNPDKRLGCDSEGGVSTLKKHPFFKKIDWKKLAMKQTKAPNRLFQQQNSQTYEDIQLKQNPMHLDQDYDESKQKVNRFINFSFIRQSFSLA